MIRIEDIATEALQYHSLQVRNLLQGFLQEEPIFANIPQPQTSDGNLLALSAALLELLSERSQQRAPAWTANIGAAEQPIFLVEAANRMPRLRILCEQGAPEPLRKRKIYAPPNYLTLV